MSANAKLIVILLALSVAAMVPLNVKAMLSVTISPPSQSALQATQASYTVSFSGGLLGATYVFGLSGLPYLTSYYFSPNSVSAISGSSTLVVSTSDVGGAYCPGSYPFTVSVTNQGAPADSGSASAFLSTSFVPPTLVVSVSSDKTTYIQGDKITLQVAVNRPAEGTITVKPPSGSPTVFQFQTGGPRTVTRTLTASQPYGNYLVSVTADDYCNSYTTDTATYSVGPNTYSVSIQLSGVPPTSFAAVQADGQSQGTMSGSETTTLSFPIGSTHTIMVDQYVSGATGVRYYCSQNTISVSSSGAYTFNYQPQYELTVGTNPMGVANLGSGGWFNAGATTQTGQAPQTIPGSAGLQYTLTGWTVDGAAASGNPLTLTMNGPHNATAQYTTQYLLTVNSPNGLGNPQGGGYYNAGSTAQFSVSSPVGYFVQQVFVQWQGDYTGTSPQGSIMMDSPKTVNAVWMTSYTNAYLAGGAAVFILVALAVLAMRRGGGKEKKQ